MTIVLCKTVFVTVLKSSDVDPYDCNNYASILTDKSKPITDELVKRELAEGFVSRVMDKPTCIHAVPKGNDSIRLITDCSRPLGEAVNAYCGDWAKKFCYNTVCDVVSCITPNCYLSVIDIQSAFRAVPILPTHRKYLGFRWEVFLR